MKPEHLKILTDAVNRKLGDAITVPFRRLTVAPDVMKEVSKLATVAGPKPTEPMFYGIPFRESPNLPKGAYVIHNAKGEIIEMGNIYDKPKKEKNGTT